MQKGCGMYRNQCRQTAGLNPRWWICNCPAGSCGRGRLNRGFETEREKAKANSNAVSTLEHEGKGCLSWAAPWAGGSARGWLNELRKVNIIICLYFLLFCFLPGLRVARGRGTEAEQVQGVIQPGTL